jgi:hypothetical protein
MNAMVAISGDTIPLFCGHNGKSAGGRNQNVPGRIVKAILCGILFHDQPMFLSSERNMAHGSGFPVSNRRKPA